MLFPAEEEVMRVGRRVYVSNLAWRTSWQDLKDHFRSAGEVVYSNVIKDADGALIESASVGVEADDRVAG